jgi:hypothetical protein
VSFWIEKLAAQRLEAFEGAFLIHPHQPRIAHHIGGEDRGKTAGGGDLLTQRSVCPQRLA